MDVFKEMMEHCHQATHFFYHKPTGLKCIISIHDTTLGPALGGCRFVNYPSEQAALRDALRLSRGMTYKSAVAGVPFGGGKSVIIGDHTYLRSREFFRAFGEFIDRLGGKYITSVDMNTTVQDLKWVKETTPHVTWVEGDNSEEGDPSPMTAFGVYSGLKSALKHKLAKDSFAGVSVAVQGVGSVGVHLCELLSEDQAKLVISDTHTQRAEQVAQRLSAQVVPADQILSQDVDILAPCAVGGIFNDATISQIKAKVIGGAANNQLLEDRHGVMLKDRGILYCPDYVINAGGLIKVYYMIAANQAGGKFHKEKAMSHVKGIERILDNIFEIASQDSIAPHEAASMIAREKLEAARKQQERLPAEI